MMNTIIETMPVMFGEQFYPGGFPLPAGGVNVNGVNVQEIFLRAGTKEEQPDDVNILRDYCLYHMKAPLFIIDPDIDASSLAKLSYEQLLVVCLDNGIDPF